MEHSAPVRVRFAPAPTGMMHLGNVRAAIMNFLFAKQQNGVFIVRVEDTDSERNYDPGAANIIADLNWLGLHYTEGPNVGGAFGPYFQSERTSLYNEALNKLIEGGHCYRCFCSAEILEKKRFRMQAMGLPPRYDRTCLHLSDAEVKDLLAKQLPFMWRFQLDHSKKVVVNDLAHGKKVFELSNFSDFPLTRSDGSFTFIFANFVDDMHMRITHIFRGEDHLTNSACQASLFEVFKLPLPVYLHMPIICNVDGKKLSKRDFGFSLRDLKNAGFLSEAIVNYLAIIGGSFVHEIMNVDELSKAVHFDKLGTTGHIKYDVEKLRWVNRKWIHALPLERFATLATPFLINAYPEAASLSYELLIDLLRLIQQDIHTLKDVELALAFYFAYIPPTSAFVGEHFASDRLADIKNIISVALTSSVDGEAFLQNLKQKAQSMNVPIKDLYVAIRLMVACTPNGISIHDLLHALGYQELTNRLNNILQTVLK